MLLYSRGWSWHEPWIVMPLVVMVGSIFFLAGDFEHTMKKMHEGGYDHLLLIKKAATLHIAYIGLLRSCSGSWWKNCEFGNAQA